MSIRKLFAVAHREFAETVKTKAFLIGALLMPGIIVGMIFLSTKVAVSGTQVEGPIRVAVLDHTARVAPEMVTLADQQNKAAGGQHVDLEAVPAGPSADDELRQLKQQVRDGTLFGVLDVPAGAINDNEACVLYIRGAGMNDRPREVRQLLNDAIKRIRLADAGLNVNRVLALSRPVPIEQQDIREQRGQPSQTMANMMTPFAFVFLLFMGVFGVSQGLLTSVIEEKSSRVVEVLLSALSPFELMAGKILGMAGAGFTMVVLWAGVGYAAATWKHVEHLVQIGHVSEFILYYVLGYLLISAILAAVGSACNTLKEAQPMMAPLTLMLIIPLMFWFNIVSQPNSTLAVVLSLIPPMTPFVMILRITSPENVVPMWQHVAAPIWLAAWVLVTMWAASRVFRVGLLMYGKPPGLRELARWVRYR
jgi:ABC-2 type transport system permease protein